MDSILLEACLCYVDGDWAFFTTQDVSKQWGDDWDDAPYEHNAEEPYEWNGDFPNDRKRKPWKIVKVAFTGEFKHPWHDHYNSPYSVKQINGGAVPWLRSWTTSDHDIPAGTTLRDFITIVRLEGGEVFTPYEGEC